jgi:hypothetical protein
MIHIEANSWWNIWTRYVNIFSKAIEIWPRVSGHRFRKKYFIISATMQKLCGNNLDILRIEDANWLS